MLGGVYRVERELGSGAMAVVVSARHTEHGQLVAIKVLRPELAGLRAVADAFREEARAIAVIHDEHVVRIHDVSPHDARPPFIVMELLSGANLGAILELRGAFDVALAVDVVAQACAGVAAAHAVSILHRDLKPSNVFVTNDGLVKVLDFGVAKSLAKGAPLAKVTTTRKLKGTPAYMSPEQLAGERDLDERTDVWSLGLILYEVVTGHFAFHAGTLPQMCLRILHHEPVPPSRYRGDVPRELEVVVLRCLQKDRAARFATATALRDALEPFKGPRP